MRAPATTPRLSPSTHPPPTEFYTLSLHDALPICRSAAVRAGTVTGAPPMVSTSPARSCACRITAPATVLRCAMDSSSAGAGGGPPTLTQAADAPATTWWGRSREPIAQPSEITRSIGLSRRSGGAKMPGSSWTSWPSASRACAVGVQPHSWTRPATSAARSAAWTDQAVQGAPGGGAGPACRGTGIRCGEVVGMQRASHPAQLTPPVAVDRRGEGRDGAAQRRDVRPAQGSAEFAGRALDDRQPLLAGLERGLGLGDPLRVAAGARLVQGLL